MRFVNSAEPWFVRGSGYGGAGGTGTGVFAFGHDHGIVRTNHSFRGSYYGLANYKGIH